MEFNTVPEAIADIKRGRLIVVVDDKERENEGDVVFAACKSTPAKINFLAKHARGLICVALSAERVEALRLPPMAEKNLSHHDTAFTVSVEVREGTTTGISAADRSATSLALADNKFGPDDFLRPGHVFPLKARRGGVLVRAGHTEAAVDLVEMAGLGNAGVICEIMNENGTMARLKDSFKFAKKHKLKIISVEDLIAYRRTQEKLIRLVASPQFPTRYGTFTAYLYEDVIHGRKHMALVQGEISSKKLTNVRVHSECLTGDVFGSMRCECGKLKQQGLEAIAKQGGIFLYMRQVEPETDFARKMEAYHIADTDTKKKNTPESGESRGAHLGVQMDVGTYGIGAQILYDLGVRHLNLLTNNPKRIQGLEGYGLKITRQSPLPGADGATTQAIPKDVPKSKSKTKSKPRPRPRPKPKPKSKALSK